MPVVAPQLESVQRLAVLIKIRIPGYPAKRYQNYCHGLYYYLGEPYEWLDFDGAALAARRLDLSNAEVTVEIGNRSARNDSLRPLREWLSAQDGWRRGRVDIYHIWPERPDAPPRGNRLQILSSDIKQGMASLRLRSPIEAVNAVIPSCSVSRQNIPELPYQTSGGAG